MVKVKQMMMNYYLVFIRGDKMKESAVTTHVQLYAAQNDITLWRNNCGGFYDDTGRFVRYGLGHISPNQTYKSSDFIGITPTVITPDMVGQTIGVFTAVEMKPTGFKFNPNNKHLTFQKNFINIVVKNGGLGGFVSSIEDFKELIK